MTATTFGLPTAQLRPLNDGGRRTYAPPIAGATIVGNTLKLPGGGVTAEFEVIVYGWSTAPGSPTLGAAQAALDATGYLGANAVPANAGVDLVPVGDPGTRSDGAFQVQKVCSSNGRDCSTGAPGGPCAGPEGFCVDSPRFLFAAAGCGPTTVISLATLNYEYGGVCSGAAIVDPGSGALAQNNVGTILLQVPANAASTYTISFFNDAPNANFTFFLDGTGVPINQGSAGVTMVPGVIQMVTGSCCTNLGVLPVVCTDNVTQSQCNALPTTNVRIFREGLACPPPDNSGPNACPACTNDLQCNDSNACTSEVCTNFVCIYTDLFNPATQCCNPAVGPSSNVLIDDGDPCTADVCDPGTGQVSHTPTTGNACDDQLDCTVNDTCDAGACAGTDVNTIPCLIDADCPLGTCGTAVAGFCECSEETPLCVEFEPGPYTDGNCYEDGATVLATITMGAGSQTAVGGQFRLTYDTACLDFVSIGPCAGDTIFTNIIQSTVDENAGIIFYAVTSDPSTMAAEGTAGPYDLACMTFIKSADCDACDICFADLNPQLTILSNNEGNRIPLDNCGCSKLIRTSGDITLNTPAGASVNADCGQPYATVTWATPNASDTCEGPLAVECVAQNVGGQPVGGLINNGGIFPQGKTFFLCTASNSCGETATNVWTVMVSDNQTLDVEVHLSPAINNTGAFNRAITFQLYNDCLSDPVTECAVITFQGPYNFPGHGKATLKVDKGNFLCLTAQDMLHTLRAVVDGADLACVNNRWTATFKGDPLLGGNWLIGGNLDAWKADATYGDWNTINILDFGMFMAELAAGASYEPNGDTTCSTPGPHGDINADGAVDALDYAFIVNNFLVNSKGLCCPAPGAGNLPAEANPITEVTVKELRRMGYGAAVVGDLNKDGKLNLDDMAAYMQGVKPQAKPVREDVKGRGTR